MNMEAVLPQECERARARASQALDCELSQLERAHLRSHLDGCESCAAFVAELREVTHELRAAPLPPPSLHSLRFSHPVQETHGRSE
jgi:predicted anti-sigma-YlaC factor YlaD